MLELIIVVILIVLVLVGVFLVYIAMKKKKEGITKELNYQAFLILGISLLPWGIVFMIVLSNSAFLGITVLGLVYLSIGLGNKDKSMKNE